MQGCSTSMLLSTGESSDLKALGKLRWSKTVLVLSGDTARRGSGRQSLPLVLIPVQEIQLQLKISEMGKYIDRQMYVLSKSPIIQKKVSRAVETLSLELNHTLEVFPASGTTESIKEPSKKRHLFNPAGVHSPEKENGCCLNTIRIFFPRNSGKGDRNQVPLDLTY